METKKMSIHTSGTVQLHAFVYWGRPAEGASESPGEKGSTAGKEIFADAAKRKRAIEEKKISDKLIYDDTQDGVANASGIADGTIFLKGDTNILISEKGEGSKHNKAGWKGLVWKDDEIEVLDRKLTKIDGKDYIKVRVRHDLVKGKNAVLAREGKELLPVQYRIYNGYVEASQFTTPLGQARAVGGELAKTPESEKPAKPELASKPKETVEKKINSQLKNLWEKMKGQADGTKASDTISLFEQAIAVELKKYEPNIVVLLKHGEKSLRIELDDAELDRANDALKAFAYDASLDEVRKYDVAKSRVVFISSKEMAFSDDTMEQAIDLIKSEQKTSTNASIKQRINYNGRRGELRLSRVPGDEDRIIFFATVKFDNAKKNVYQVDYTVDTDAAIAVPNIAVELQNRLERLIEE